MNIKPSNGNAKIMLIALLYLLFLDNTLAQTAWPEPQPDNIALFKPAKQINTFGAGHANRAVDGNTDGHWHRGSVSHTNGSENPWWEVNLLEEYDITSITVYNRTDCCPDRLQNFVIRVSEQKFEGNYGGEIYNSDKSTFENSKTFTKTARGRYVRIYLEGSGILSLAEVVINGKPVNPNRNLRKNENIALGKRARQSSVHDRATANRANDDDRDGRWSHGSVMHTKADRQAFWEVDLGKNYLVKEIKVFNRTDSYRERLDGFNIYVTKEIVNGSEQRKNPFAADEKKFDTKYKSFTNTQVGRYVRIEINRDQPHYLHLAEVEVYGTEIGDIEIGEAESNIMYKVSIFRNLTPMESSIKSIKTKSISEGMDFSRTVSKQHKKYKSLSLTSKLAVNYGIVSASLEVTGTVGDEETNTTQNSQAGKVNESSTESTEITQTVPGNCTRYEFHKFVINQSPLTYKFNGETYSWYRVNQKATPSGDITVMVFPNNETPNLNATDDNWVLPAYYKEVLENHPNYIQN
jgi:hypothetical protein